MPVIKFICYLAFVAILLPHRTAYAYTTIKNEFLDCFSESEIESDTNLNNIDKIDCTIINTELANCTCTKDYIDCSNKGFYAIPADLTKMPATVHRLFFSRNQITELGQLDLGTETKMSMIDLKKNKIKSIDAEKFFSSQLTTSLSYMSMCGNVNLNDFNSVKVNFTNLNWLELNHVIEPLEIKDAFFNKEKFPSLVRLNLNDANLKLGNHPFDRLDKLELLRLDHNKLNQLPCESFMEMLSLTSLNLNNNFLSKKPDVSQDCLKNSMELSELHLQANVLHEDNLEWMNLAQFKKLSKLDLSGNKFTKIPYHALAGIKSIKSLKITIDEREFTRPKATVMLWPNLTFLDLSGSSIRSIGNRSFEFISTNLTELILRNCQIHVIEPDAFAKLNSLILLDLSVNNLKTLHKPSSLALFNYDLLRGNANLSENNFDCSKYIEWFINFYDYDLFDRSVTCYLINGTRIPVQDFIRSKKMPAILPAKKNNYNMLAIILLVLIVLVIAMGAVYIVKRKQMKQRQQQYRYRYFTERSQDDGFDTDNIPVYRDCTVSLRIKDGEDANNIINNNADSSAVLTEQPDVVNS